jgi:hypothetical protein
VESGITTHSLVIRLRQLRQGSTGSSRWRREAELTTAPAAAPDAELLALGKQVDQLERQYHEVMERDRPRIERELQLLEAQEPFEKLDEEFGPQSRPDALDILDTMDAPIRRIMALPVTTLAGLAVKAQVARFSCEHFWDEPEEDLDWHELMARKLIDAVLDFCRSD